MGEGLSREEKAPSAKPRLGTPEVRGTTLSTHFVLCGILARMDWAYGGGRGSTLSWNSHVILWDIIPWLSSTDMDQKVGGGLLPLQEPWLPGFL